MKIKIQRQEEFKKGKNKIKEAWNWIWHSDSLLSWLVALALAFVTVKFIFFPLLSFLLATPLPLVVVESSSMHHDGNFIGNVIGSQNNFEQWWNEKGFWYLKNGIEKEEAENWPLKTGFDKGDIIVVWGWSEPKVGDVIIFDANTEHPIIHRIVSIENGVIQTKGDNNNDQLLIEKNISKEDLLGKAVFRIPKLGWLKLLFVEITKSFTG